jgi:hypothetical protein
MSICLEDKGAAYFFILVLMVFVGTNTRAKETQTCSQSTGDL